MRAVEDPVQLRRSRLNEVWLLRRTCLGHKRAKRRAVRQGVGQNSQTTEHCRPGGGIGLVDREQTAGGISIGCGGEELKQPPVIGRVGGVQPEQ